MRVIGIDEVGRGAWAGPLTVGAAELTSDFAGLADSKRLSASRRETLAEQLRHAGARLGLGWVSPAEIDRLGLTAAMELAIKRSLIGFDVDDAHIIIDGHLDYLGWQNSEAIIDADDSHPVVSAASIVAKVARDNLMKKLHLRFDGYGFDRNVGYGTSLHRSGLEQFGHTRIHRLSFKPVQKYVTTSINYQHWSTGRERRR